MIGPTARRGATLCLVMAALAASSGTGPVARAQADPGLSPEEQDAIGATWLDGLNSYYASGDSVDIPPVTENGLEALRAYDWRFGAVEAGTAKFEETWDIFESTQWDETIVDDELASFELRLGFDVARLAATIDAVSGQTVELTDGVQRRVLNATFVSGEAPDAWLLDAIGPPKGSLDLGLRELASVVPCPRLGNPARARDPFRMQPWCTANGEGRRLTVSGFRDGGEGPMPDLSFPGISRACGWEAVTMLVTGWPPGTPINGGTDFQEHRYVRDPRGEVPGAGAYRRSVRPPRDAVSTGVTNGHATIWTSESLGENAILVQIGDRFERWPSTDAGCPSN